MKSDFWSRQVLNPLWGSHMVWNYVKVWLATQDSKTSRISSSLSVMFRPSSFCLAALSSIQRILLRTLNRMGDISLVCRMPKLFSRFPIYSLDTSKIQYAQVCIELDSSNDPVIAKCSKHLPHWTFAWLCVKFSDCAISFIACWDVNLHIIYLNLLFTKSTFCQPV